MCCRFLKCHWFRFPCEIGANQERQTARLHFITLHASEDVVFFVVSSEIPVIAECVRKLLREASMLLLMLGGGTYVRLLKTGDKHQETVPACNLEEEDRLLPECTTARNMDVSQEAYTL